MGSLGDNDGKTAQFTELFDSQLSPSSSPGQQDDSGDDNEREFLESTLPFYDNTPVEDALETQEVNFPDEIEILHIAGETQVLDDIEDINTQLLDELDGVPMASESDGTDGTEILENIDEFSTDDPRCKDNAQSADSKKIQCETFGGHGEKKVWEQTEAITDGQTSSVQKPPLFTYLRVETLRASALAIQNMILKDNGDTMSITSRSQSLGPLIAKDDRESFLVGSDKGRKLDYGNDNEETNEFRNKNKCKVASSAVRRLFVDDSSTESKRPSLNSNDVNGGEGSSNLFICDNEIAGLSYVNSQEPGELSQANALDFVDRFLQDNLIEFDQEVNHGKNVQEKSKSLPSTKGQQNLAKEVNDKGKAVKAGIFDWDDSCEDECGGDILIRRREDIFGSGSNRQKSCPQVQNIKGSRVKVGEKQLSIPNKRMSAVHSDSRIVLHSLNVSDNTVQETSTTTRRNFVNELEANARSSRGQLEPNATSAAELEMLGVGLDTQMAAEAMEELCNGEGIVNHDANATHVTRSTLTDQPNNSSAQKPMEITLKEQSGKFNTKMKKRRHEETGQSAKRDILMKRSKRSKLKVEENLISTSENDCEMPSLISKKRKSARASKRRSTEKLNNCAVNESGSGKKLVDKRQRKAGASDFTPVACRTRQSALNQSMKPERLSRNFREEDRYVVSLEKRNCGAGIQVSKALDPKLAMACSGEFGVEKNAKLLSKLSCVKNRPKINMVDYPRRRRSLRKSSRCEEGFKKLGGWAKESVLSEEIAKSTVQKRKMKTDARNVTRSNVNSHSQSASVISSVDQNKGKLSQPILDRPNALDTYSANIKSCRKNDTDTDLLLSAKILGDTELGESSPKRFKSSGLASVTPAGYKTPANDVSPVCMGDNYYKHSCNRNLSTSWLVKVPHRELRSLSATGSEPSTPSRKRRDMNDVRVLYSNHLDEDIVKHQKKILARLGASVASSITDATHFIADQFVRTRNMLVAIASGKPVVTHLRIDSCGQASCFIDEKNYILRDSKKEREFGFSMPVSLARASLHPLLEGRTVFITPNAKPSQETISSLVKAVQGQAVETIGRSALKDDKIPDNLLVLTCEEDYATCVPFLEKGAAVYSSELLLNGIVTQKLEYERHVLFADNVKKTRSTIWLKRDGRTFLPVTKCK